MTQVFVEVDRGVALVVRQPKGVDVEIIDLDLLRGGAFGDVHRYWNLELSSRARAFVAERRPEIAKSIPGDCYDRHSTAREILKPTQIGPIKMV
jgi:hypothetical protein